MRQSIWHFIYIFFFIWFIPFPCALTVSHCRSVHLIFWLLCSTLCPTKFVILNSESNSFEHSIRCDTEHNTTDSNSNKNSSAKDNCVHILTSKGIINVSVAEKSNEQKKNQYKEFVCFVSVESKNNRIISDYAKQSSSMFAAIHKKKNPPWKFLH